VLRRLNSSTWKSQLACCICVHGFASFGFFFLFLLLYSLCYRVLLSVLLVNIQRVKMHGEGHIKYIKYVSFPWPPLEAALSIFILSSIFFVNFFGEEINKDKGYCHQCRIISFIKMSVFKRSVL
jgi:hypothetical protein